MGLPVPSCEWWVGTEPVLTFEADGTAKLRMRLKAQDRTYDREKKEWVNGKELWVNATVWRAAAENVANSIVKGDNVVASGKLSSREYKDKQGADRTAIDFDVQEIGPSLRFRTTPHGAGDSTKQATTNTRAGASTGAATAAPESGTGGGSDPGW